MKVFDVLSTMNPDALTSIQLETFSEPIAFGKVGAIKLNPKLFHRKGISSSRKVEDCGKVQGQVFG